MQLPLLPPVTSIKITVPGEPVPKARHRARIVTPRFKPPFIHFYQDSATEKYEQQIALVSQMMMQGRGLILGALEVHVTAWVAVPTSWSDVKRSKAINGEIRPISRPDSDNYAKAALDGMNGVVFKDDSQVVDLHVSKRYSEEPKLEIEIFTA